MNPGYIAIEGPIGVGKTTLAGYFRDQLGAAFVDLEHLRARFRQRWRRPGPCGRARSWPSTLPTCVPVTTIMSIPSAQSSSIARRRSGVSAARSGTAVPSQSNRTASKRRSSSGNLCSSSLIRAVDRPRGERRRRRRCSAIGGTAPPDRVDEPTRMSRARTEPTSEPARNRFAASPHPDGRQRRA